MIETFKILGGLLAAGLVFGAVLYGIGWTTIWIWKGIHSLDDQRHKRNAWSVLLGLIIIFIIAGGDSFATAKEVAVLIAAALGIFGIGVLFERISNSVPENTNKFIGIVLWSIPLVGSAAAIYVFVEVMSSPGAVDIFGGKIWRLPVFIIGSGVLCVYSIVRVSRFLQRP